MKIKIILKIGVYQIIFEIGSHVFLSNDYLNKNLEVSIDVYQLLFPLRDKCVDNETTTAAHSVSLTRILLRLWFRVTDLLNCCLLNQFKILTLVE